MAPSFAVILLLICGYKSAFAGPRTDTCTPNGGQCMAPIENCGKYHIGAKRMGHNYKCADRTMRCCIPKEETCLANGGKCLNRCGRYHKGAKNMGLNYKCADKTLRCCFPKEDTCEYHSGVCQEGGRCSGGLKSAKRVGKQGKFRCPPTTEGDRQKCCFDQMQTNEREVQSVIVCEHKVLELTCPAGKIIKVISANYGRTKPYSEVCSYRGKVNENCKAAGSFEKVFHVCEDKARCAMLAGNEVFGDPCLDTFKYLEVEYRCETGEEKRLFPW